MNKIFIDYKQAVDAMADFFCKEDEEKYGRRKVSRSLQKELAKYILKDVDMYVEGGKSEQKADTGSPDQDR